MKLTVWRVAVFAVLTLIPCAARAQSLSLGITDGLVTLDAQGVTMGQILARWTDATGAALVNAEKLTSAPITLQFAGIPERQALTMVLRSAGGYILVGRSDATDPVERIARVIIIAGAPGARSVSSSAPPPLFPSGSAVEAAAARASAALVPAVEVMQSPTPQQPAIVPSAAASAAAGGSGRASPNGTNASGAAARPGVMPPPQEPPQGVIIPSGGAARQR